MAARTLALSLVLLGCLTAAAEPPLTAEQKAQLKERDELVRRAEALKTEGKYDEALAPAGKALELTRTVRGPEHPEVADALERLASLQELAGQVDAAVKVRQEALALREKLDGDKHWRTADARLALELTRKVAGLAPADQVEVVAALRQEQEARRLEQRGKDADAERAAAAALAVYGKHLGESAAVARALHQLSLARWKQRNVKGSQKATEQALAIRRKVLPPGHPDIAKSLNNLGLAQSALRDYAAARRSHEEALAIKRKALPKDHPDLAWSLNNLGVVQQELRDYAAARENHEEALAIRRKVLPKDHPDITISLNNLGIVQRHLRDYEAARKSHEEALAIRRKVLPKDHPGIADSLNSLGNVQQELREYAAARESHEEALAIRRKALPKDHPDIAVSLNNLGIVQRKLREYAAARRSLEEALAIFRKALPEGHPAIAMSLNNLGDVQRDLRDYAAARRSLEEALVIKRQALPKDHPDIAMSLNSLGNTQWELREYAAARKSHEEALAIRRKALPAGDPLIAESLHSLGIVQHDLRDYAAARRSYEEALAITRRALPKDHPDIAMSLISLGNTQWKLREYAAARRSHEEALAILRQALPKDHPDIALSLNNLGIVHKELRDYAAARKSHEEALAIYRKALPAGDPLIAMSLNNLGIVQYKLREYAAARRSFEEALAIRRKVLPKDHPDIAMSLNNLGIVQRELRDYAAARRSHEEALAILRQALPKDHPDIAMSLNNLGELCLESSDAPQTACPLLAEAVAIKQRELSRLALAQAEAEQFHAAAELRTSLDLLLSVAPPPEPHSANDRYAAVVGFKGAVTGRQRWARRGRQLVDAEAARLLRQLQQANSQLLGVALADRAGDRAEDVRELSERRARLERELAAYSPAYRRFLQQGRRSPADVRAALPAGTALLDFFDYHHAAAPPKGQHGLGDEPRLVAFVVRPDRAGVVEVPLGPSERLADLIDRWCASHGRGKTPPADQPDPATELRQLLWEPLEKHLEGVKVVLVSPDGPLNGLPLAALPGREPGKFLVHHYAFAVVPVPQLLPDLLADKPKQADGPAALVVGDVDFDAAPAAGGAAAAGDRLPPLPGTREEARSVYDLFGKTFPGRPAELLTGNAATKAAFVARASGRSHLLLATHGFFLPEPKPKEDAERGLLRSLRSPLLEPHLAAGYPELRSGLAFAGANRAALGKGDAFLTALEASELDLDRVDLAVLSACETGLGKAHGGEGVLGLQRAFQLAGARTAVTSLWKVPDAATQALMTRIHRNLWEKHLGKGEALREAQLWLLQEGGKHPELLRGGLEPPERPKGEGPVPPFYWAAFVLSGDWR
jgi:CHAT domain-containing protein/tetratricopeptide (TPR) repeat protein